MKCAAVIPARLQSTRLPRKVLVDLNGQPLLWHVWRRVNEAALVDSVCVATDSEEVYATVRSWGGSVFMTSPDCRSGTERIASLVDRLDADLILNVQADEPMVDPRLLDDLVADWKRLRPDIITPVFAITDLDDLQSPNLVKVVRSAQGRTLYFSRSPVPFVRDLPMKHWLQQHSFWGHIGIYGYSRGVLENYSSLPVSQLEDIERLEQLRFLEAGYIIHTIETMYHAVGVDTPEDLDRVRVLMQTAV
jgi:3-deoxy-manno-octulosonate cytidylyltransferase (CMP-KDO synthetase)